MWSRCGRGQGSFGITDMSLAASPNGSAGKSPSHRRRAAQIGRLCRLGHEELHACLQDGEKSTIAGRMGRKQKGGRHSPATPSFMINARKIFQHALCRDERDSSTQMEVIMAAPAGRLRLLSWLVFWQAPLAGRPFSIWACEVIKVESPAATTPGQWGPPFMNATRINCLVFPFGQSGAKRRLWSIDHR